MRGAGWLATALLTAAGIAAPLLFTHLFAFGIATHGPLHLPGAPFLLAALLLAAAFLAVYRITLWMRPSRLPAHTVQS